MFRIIVNNDPNIKQSYFLVPDNDPYFNQSYFVSPNHMNMNMNMNMMSRKKHKKHRKSKHHGNYGNHGQYGQFGVPLLSPEFLSPEFPMPLPVPGYISGHISPQAAINIIIKAADTAAAKTPSSPVIVQTAVTDACTNLGSTSTEIMNIISKANNAATTEVSRTIPLPLPTAQSVAAAVKTALTALHAPGLPFGPFGMAGTVTSFPFTHGSPIMSPVPIPVTYPRVNNIRHLTNPDDDPELRRKVVKHFYKQLKEIYFIDKLKKLFQYIIIENNGNNGNNGNTGNTGVRLVKTYEEYKKNENNNNDSNIKIKFITENIFSKYDLEVLISKLIAKYGMLNSDDENNMHWYTAKYKYASLVKKAMYKKIKYRFEKKVKF